MRTSLAPGAIVTAAILVASAILSACDDSLLTQPMERRPERFGRDDQFADYVKELQEYYGVTGRGRYGKRQMRTIMSDVYVRDSVQPAPPAPPAPAAPFLRYRGSLRRAHIRLH